MVGWKYYADMLALNEAPEAKACGPAKGIQLWEWVGHRREDKKMTDGTMHGKFAVFTGRPRWSDRTTSIRAASVSTAKPP